MSEVSQPNHPFLVKGEDGEVYAGADEQANAVVLAGALFVAASALAYRPSISVVQVSTGTVVAVIGQPTPVPEEPT